MSSISSSNSDMKDFKYTYVNRMNLNIGATNANPFGDSLSDYVSLGIRKGIIEGVAAVVAKGILELSGGIISYVWSWRSIIIDTDRSSIIDTDRAAFKVAILAGECSKVLDKNGEVLKKGLQLIEDRSEREDLRTRALVEIAKCRENYILQERGQRQRSDALQVIEAMKALVNQDSGKEVVNDVSSEAPSLPS